MQEMGDKKAQLSSPLYRQEVREIKTRTHMAACKSHQRDPAVTWCKPSQLCTELLPQLVAHHKHDALSTSNSRRGERAPELGKDVENQWQRSQGCCPPCPRQHASPPALHSCEVCTIASVPHLASDFFVLELLE